ncbi:MAG TPA: hypothetical protein VN616_17125 [Puia sp.]|nr:hypothetical protein [Puia sp.]
MRLLLLSGILLAASLAEAQSGNTGANASRLPDPPYLNQVYYYWSDSLLACPRTDGQMSNKIKALGFGGSQMSYAMDGGRSALRIKAGDSLRFVVKMVSMAGDPSSVVKLYKFESKKDSREALLSSQSRFGGSKDPKNEVSYDVRRSGSDVFILIPSARLAPGEYAFMNSMMMKQSGVSVMYTFFTFGVDP